MSAFTFSSSTLIEGYHSARAITDQLFARVRPDSFYERPIPERHRIIFYVGHLEAFDWNLIGPGALGTPHLREDFDRLFAFGIDPGPDGLPRDGAADWPRLEEVLAYGARVREALDSALERIPEQLLHVAIEHRLMHAETFAYMLHNLPYRRKSAPRDAAPIESGPPVNPKMIEIGGGPAVLGRSREDGFGWDNEFPETTIAVDSFAIGSHKVTNGEYLAFVEAGGPAPHFWRQAGHGWLLRGMFDEFPLPLDWPVYVSHEQASQYASWRGKRLPTEPEYHRALGDIRSCPPDPVLNNFDFHRWDPVPVGYSPANELGIAQLTGNGWEWTSTVFQPFPGFQPFAFYPGYSAGFFDGQHYVLKGASPRTAARLARPSFRNWFRGSYPYAYATFRLAEN